MEYIKKERFLILDNGIKQIIIDAWKPSIGDLFTWASNEDLHSDNGVECCTSENSLQRTLQSKGFRNNERIPILTSCNIKDIIYTLTKQRVDIKYYSEKEIELYSRISILEKFTFKYSNIREVDALFDMLIKICEIKLEESRED